MRLLLDITVDAKHLVFQKVPCVFVASQADNVDRIRCPSIKCAAIAEVLPNCTIASSTTSQNAFNIGTSLEANARSPCRLEDL